MNLNFILVSLSKPNGNGKSSKKNLKKSNNDNNVDGNKPAERAQKHGDMPGQFRNALLR